MQVKIDPLSLPGTSAAFTNGGKGASIADASFLDAVRAVENADTPAARAENEAAGNETMPLELYQIATGRRIDKGKPSQKHWTDEMLAYVVGNGAEIDTANKINWESNGEKQLTEDQIAQLKKKYNVKELSPQDYYDFMSDLTRLNVLSGEDCKGAHLTHTGISGQGFRFRPAGVPSLVGRFQTGDMTKIFETALENLLKNLAWMESDEYLKANGITEEERAADLEAVKKDIHSRQVMLDLINQLR